MGREFYEQCMSCSFWFPYDRMYYYMTNEQWVCSECYELYQDGW